jgi:hypothetical protein
MSPCKDKPEQKSEAETQDKERLKYFHYLNRAEIRKNGQVIGITMGKIQFIGEDISTPADLTATRESKTDPR